MLMYSIYLRANLVTKSYDGCDMRVVFSKLQNCADLSDGDFKDGGSAFQHVGPETAKAREPHMKVFILCAESPYRLYLLQKQAILRKIYNYTRGPFSFLLLQSYPLLSSSRLPPLSPPFPYPVPHPLLLEVGLISGRRSGERCKPQLGQGQRPSRNRFWCILALKSHILWQQF